VEHYFAALAPSEQHSRWQTGLFDLISNVILLPDETRPDRFHFRFSIETTSSFQALDAHTQHELRELYVDYFFRRQDNFWMREAMQKLPALKRGTNMLVCGEDLGMVPACVPEAMKQLGLLTLEVQRMPKRLGQEFSYPKDAPYLSVVTPGTHDMSTVRGWWRENRSVSQKFYNQVLGLSGTAPEDCEPWINRAVVRQHLDAPAMWSVFMLQDLLGMDAQLRRPDPTEERINVPADAKNFWRYRMHLWLEDLFAAKQFNSALRAEIQQAGR
jgi:4-alpha-glucanotransferase